MTWLCKLPHCFFFSFETKCINEISVIVIPTGEGNNKPSLSPIPVPYVNVLVYAYMLLNDNPIYNLLILTIEEAGSLIL